VSIDANGDRNGDYSLLDMNPKTGRFQVSASLNMTLFPLLYHAKIRQSWLFFFSLIVIYRHFITIRRR